MQKHVILASGQSASMDKPPALHISRSDTNGFLSARPGLMNSTTRGRSSSVTPSLKSNASRITDVYDDPEVVKGRGDSSDNGYSSDKRKSTLIDRVIDRSLGYLGLCRKSKVPEMHWHAQKEPDGDWSSPWVLPVVVLSSRHDTDKIPKKKIGKCTIDTGNTLGNIVSRAFVEDVLEYPKSSIRELTKAEEEGGAGVTGHRLVPEGAIYLTWYHQKSTRTFHNMRFLISEHSAYDLIIGARSIQEHGIQDVPNLMTLSKTFITQNIDQRLFELRQAFGACDKEKGDLRVKITKSKADGDEVKTKILQAELVDCKKQCAIAKKRLELYEAKGNDELVSQIQRELDQLTGQRKILTPTTTNSTAVSDHRDGEQGIRKRETSG